MKITTFINDPVPSNTYVIVDEGTKRCVVVDPGSKVQDNVRDYICENGYNLEYILLTHEHFDHCWGVNYLLDYFDAKVVATKLCSEWVKTPMNYFNKLYYNSDEMYSVRKVDLLVEDIGMKLDWCNIIISFIEAKGHTNRGMCIFVGNVLFSGDTMIFNTKPFLKKKYGASKEDLKKTIDNIYSSYSADTIVFAGHGDSFRLADMKDFYTEYFNLYG